MSGIWRSVRQHCPLIGNIFQWPDHRPPQYPFYPFLFRLAECPRPDWDRHPRPDAYWGTVPVLGRNWAAWVCLVPSRVFRCEYWATMFLFTFLPALLWQSQEVMLIDSWVPLVCAGAAPFILGCLCNMLLPCHDFMREVWPGVPEANRPWVRRMLTVKEPRSPIVWAMESADELVLRYALLDYFGARGPNPMWPRGFVRIALIVFAPIYLSFLGIHFQAAAWTLWGHTSSNEFNQAAAPVFGATVGVWLLFALLYSWVQLRRIKEQIFAEGNMRSQKLLPIALPPHCLQLRLKVESRAVIFGLPGGYSAVAAVSLSLLQLLFPV